MSIFSSTKSEIVINPSLPTVKCLRGLATTATSTLWLVVSLRAENKHAQVVVDGFKKII